MAGAAKLFAGAKMSWDQVKKAADSDDAKFTPFPLAGTLSVALKTDDAADAVVQRRSASSPAATRS